MFTVNARGITGLGAPFEPLVIERRDLGPRDVLIDIAFCGICHSDVHRAAREAGVHYPLVPGHEIAGVISAIGAEVTKFAVGDRAGVGCMVDSCGECDHCAADEEQFCRNGWIRTYNWLANTGERTHGGYSEKIVVDEDFALRIPDSISLETAAPLFCAGITMYSPLRRWNARPGSRVAFIGFGGLGHIGVQIAKAMGAHVTVLDLSLDKREDGLRLGADEYYRNEPELFDKLIEAFDIIISTVPASLDLNAFLPLLDLDGVFIWVGAPDKPLSFDGMLLRNDRRAIVGTTIGGIRETQEMIDFCAEHAVGAEVEIVNANQIDEAFKRVSAGDVRFRFVIDASTINEG